MPFDTKKCKIKLFVTPEMSAKMNHALIRADEIKKTIVFCEETGRKIVNKKTGNFSGYCTLGSITLWVEYKPEDDGYALINAYSHRLQILE